VSGSQKREESIFLKELGTTEKKKRVEERFQFLTSSSEEKGRFRTGVEQGFAQAVVRKKQNRGYDCPECALSHTQTSLI